MATSDATGMSSDFRVGTVLGRSLSVLQQSFVSFAALALVMSLPTLLSDFGVGAKQPSAVQGGAVPTMPIQHLPPGYLAGFGIAMLFWVLLFALCQPAIVYGAFLTMRSGGFGLGAALARALRRFFPVLGTAIVLGLLTGLATILLVIPGVIVYLMCYVAVAVCVVEGLGPIGSIGRSAELTKGFRWKLFGLSICLVLLNVVSFALRAIFLSIGGPTVGAILSAVVSIVIIAYGLIVHAVAYHDLRVAKEGIDIEQLAAVFD